MKTRPVIAVIGATGTQGSGLIRAIHGDPARAFHARAITRNPNSPSAAALAAEYAEVCCGNLDEPDSLARALHGVHGLYAMTNYWEHGSPEREIAQAYNIATAARSAGVRHVVWSTLEDTRVRVPLSDCRMPTLHNRYKVPHMDAKGESDAFFRDLPTTYLRTSFYWDNLIHFGMEPQPDPHGQIGFLLPMGDRKLPGIAANDIGACALGVFKRSSELVGRTIGIAGEHLTGKQMAQALASAFGEAVRHTTMPHSQYAQLGFPGADDLANMFQYKHDFNLEFCSERSVERTRELHPKLMSFQQWLATNAVRIPRHHSMA